MILAPFALLIVVSGIENKFAVLLPSLTMYQCGNWAEVFPTDPVHRYHDSLSIAVFVYCGYEFILCTIFFGGVFWLRNIHDEFNINKEIRRMSMILYISDTLYIISLLYFYDTVFVILGFV